MYCFISMWLWSGRTQKLIMGFFDVRCARKALTPSLMHLTVQELLGQLGTVVVAEPGSNEIQVQFSPDLVQPMSDNRRGYQV